MIAHYVGELDRVLVLGAKDKPHLLRRSVFLKRWCGTLKRMHAARKKDILVDVAAVGFDENETDWRVETDECNRPVLTIGPAVALAYCCADPSDRMADVQLGDLFAPRHWIAREAADAADALARRMLGELERQAPPQV